MAKSSGVGELLGWGILGVGVYWLGSANNWFGLFGGTTTASAVPSTAPVTSPAAPTTPAASVSLAGPVTTTINNALKANVSINGAIQNLSVIPGGDAYNSSGVDVTSSLAALGVTPAQIYSLMQAAYSTQQASTTTPPATTSTKTTVTSTVSPASTHRVPPGRNLTSTAIRRGVAGYGMGGRRMMTGSNRINYVPRGAGY